MNNRKLFTSESVTEGHPDKMCDQISDAVLDEIIKNDPFARVACEVTATTGLIHVMGEITTECYVDIPKIARNVVREIGYDRAKYGFDADTCGVITSINEQSLDISSGVNNSLETRGKKTADIGAGDQGMMFGYASNETKELMPMPIQLAHNLAKQLTNIRKNKIVDFLRPDGKTQVTIEYDENNKPVRVDTIVISSQHSEAVNQKTLEEAIIEEIIKKVIPSDLIDINTKFLINPSGRFVVGGPCGDSGLTGRKIIVDTYGGMGRHGGGAFSGKDPTKVDRSAAYAARNVAKTVVAARLADKCEVQLAYAIGVAKPVSILIETFGTNKIDEIRIAKAVNQIFDLRPSAIIDYYDLRKPIYRQLAAYGHMGREDLNVSFERCDKVDELKAVL